MGSAGVLLLAPLFPSVQFFLAIGLFALVVHYNCPLTLYVEYVALASYL